MACNMIFHFHLRVWGLIFSGVFWKSVHLELRGISRLKFSPGVRYLLKDISSDITFYNLIDR